ncbi:hypothetical protein K402DRAFT_454120 [Aulographum hederae CBS 113979]|uniref:Uncharacterized protein n=1 Tax=Aulographum hederae CBS 113979 TaxID=1176131 RepID=A0A6G1H1E5_9PEZI|nr:hypothetical protein K402DRAFT_454120 [Aulographum hederae CBS 113979]
MASRFHWDLSGLDLDRFRAYASLLRLRSGGQVDERLEAEQILQIENSSAESDDADSVAPLAVILFDETRLREAFQDRVAELVSNVKGGYHVAATLLVEMPDVAQLVVAKNESFSPTDENFLAKLQDLLRAIAKADSPRDNDLRALLWEETTTYSDARLRAWVKDFQRTANVFLKACPETPLQSKAKSLRLEILSFLDKSLKSPRSTFPLTAHAKWEFYGEPDYLLICNNRLDLARSLELAVGFLARLEISFHVLMRAAKRLDNLQALIISRLDRSAIKVPKNMKRKERNSAWSLGQTFQSLSQPLSDTTVKSAFGEKWTKHEVITRLEKIRSQTPLKFMPRSRASHGKIYSAWVVPECDNIPQEELVAVVSALISVEESLKRSLQIGKRQKVLRAAKESTVGGSSISTKLGSNILSPESAAAVLLKMQHLTYGRQVEVVINRREHMRKRIHIWRTLEETPPKVALTKKLGIAIRAVNEQNVAVSTVRARGAAAKLAKKPVCHTGLYIGLVHGCNVGSQDLDEWNQNGTLVQNITSESMEIPESHRGGYFPCFLQHLHLLGAGTTNQAEALGTNIVEEAKEHLSREDQMKDIRDLLPIAKKVAFLFLAMALAICGICSGFAPALTSTMKLPLDSYTIGSCVETASKRNVKRVGWKSGVAVGPKVPQATFDEFWRAFSRGKLVQLMNKYNLGRGLRECSRLEQFLAIAPDKPHPMVWRLSHYLALEVTALDIPEEAIKGGKHFGFSSNMNARVRIEMRPCYEKLLREGDSLALDRARCNGTLLEYAQQHLPAIDKGVLQVFRQLDRETNGAPPLAESVASGEPMVGLWQTVLGLFRWF